MSEWLDIIPDIPLDELERNYVIAALKRHQCNRAKTAEALGIPVRNLRNKIRRYKDEGFDVPPAPRDPAAAKREAWQKSQRGDAE